MKRFAIIVLMFCLLGAPALAADPVPPSIQGLIENVGTYVQYTGSQVVLAWSKVDDPLITKYEVLAYNLERKMFLVRGNTPQKEAPSLSFTLNKSGHYIFYARAVNENEADEQYRYSVWSNSLNEADTQGDKKFWVYVYIAPPSDAVIE